MELVMTIFLHSFLAGGLDTDEPWQGRWEGGVLVECHGEQERKGQSKTDGQTAGRTSDESDSEQESHPSISAFQLSLSLFTLIRAAENNRTFIMP